MATRAPKQTPGPFPIFTYGRSPDSRRDWQPWASPDRQPKGDVLNKYQTQGRSRLMVDWLGYVGLQVGREPIPILVSHRTSESMV